MFILYIIGRKGKNIYNINNYVYSLIECKNTHSLSIIYNSIVLLIKRTKLINNNKLKTNSIPINILEYQDILLVRFKLLTNLYYYDDII